MISSIHLASIPTAAVRAADVSVRSMSFQDSLERTAAARDQSGSLSAQEIARLAGQYDPDHMTQKEYESFLDDLEKTGALSREDKMLVKNPEMRFMPFDPNGIMPCGGEVEAWGAEPLARLKSLAELDGNVGLLVKAMLERELELAKRTTPLREDRQRIAALRTVSDILDRMRTVSSR